MRDGAKRPKPPCFIQTKSGLSYGELPVTKPTGKTKRALAQQGASSKPPAKQLNLVPKTLKCPARLKRLERLGQKTGISLIKRFARKIKKASNSEVCKKDKENEQFSFARAPKPLPLEEWVDIQKEEIPPKGRRLQLDEIPLGCPDSLIMIEDEQKRKRMCVPESQRPILARYNHEVLLHQKGKRVSYDLEDECYWPYMEKDIKEISDASVLQPPSGKQKRMACQCQDKPMA
jgi:hypothetical protein